MTSMDILGRLSAMQVVPVIRTADAALAAAAVDWLGEAGYRTFEITLTIPGALGLIGRLAGRDDLLIGAGTVFSADEARACIAAGADYLVSPCVAPPVAAAAAAAGVACLLGAMTPTEVAAACAAGADGVKIFPAGSAGGPDHIRALRSIFPAVPFVPTGGIDADSIADYLAAGAAFVAVGGRLVDPERLAAGDRGGFVAAARQLLSRAGRADRAARAKA